MTSTSSQPAQKVISKVFGTLSQSGKRVLAIDALERYLPEDKDNYDKLEVDLAPRKNAYYYKYEIRKYARQGSVGIRKAMELFHDMKFKDRLAPNLDSFSPLIYGCAKAGYTKKAFELYEESLRYYNKPTQSTVTCLLNSCAETPFPEYGIKRLDWFMTHIKTNYNYTLNRTQYHSAIKAYGKLGRLNEASKLVEEMISNGLFPDDATFCMLLVGCASDKESGATLALRVFKRMKLYGVKPSIVTYRLMLRCIRDCGMGSAQLIKQTLGELPALTSLDQKLLYKKLGKKNSFKDSSVHFEWAPLITDLGKSIATAVEPQPRLAGSGGELTCDPNSTLVSLPTSSLTVKAENRNRDLPNLLSDDHLDLIYRIEGIQIDKLTRPFDRLKLFGDMHGYLETMVRDGCKPDTKTFGLILDCIKVTKKKLLEYFRLSKDYSISRDLLFYDLLIRETCYNVKDETRLEQAFFYLDEMHKDGIRPNISTFEALARGCNSLKEALDMMKDVERSGFVLSDGIIKKLYKCAIAKMDFKYLNGLIKFCKERKHTPTRQLVDSLEKTRILAHNIILKYEKGQLSDIDKPEWLNEKQISEFDRFAKNLGIWLGKVELKDDEHPWSQFYVNMETNKTEYGKFVRKFHALEKVKKEAIERGEGFGNLAAKADELLEQSLKN